jgi:hypothetical protein
VKKGEGTMQLPRINVATLSIKIKITLIKSCILMQWETLKHHVMLAYKSGKSLWFHRALALKNTKYL